MSDAIQDRADSLRARVAAACARAGRREHDVLVLAVSKTQPPERIAEACAAGFDVFGENKVQEARAKIPLCPGSARWHLVGHLQSNKVRPACELFEQIHSVDSEKLLELIDRACDDIGRRMSVLIEVNVSGEASKFGAAPDIVPALIAKANALPRIDLNGLMTMAPFAPEAEKARPHFRRLRELRDRWAVETGTPLPELSMGMSGDFEVAIEEGSTCVRIGTLLFGERNVTA